MMFGGGAPPVYGPPTNYREEHQLRNYQFEHYRRMGRGVRWGDKSIVDTRYRWGGLKPVIPRANIAIFQSRMEPWKVHQQRPLERGKQRKNDLDNLPDHPDERTRKAWRRMRDAKRYFHVPRFSYQKTLGYGGLGLALLFRYEGFRTHKNVVAKVSLRNWDANDIRREERATRRVARAAHCIQLVEPISVTLQSPQEYPKEPVPYDTSDESVSSGDESIYEEPPPRRRRSERTEAEHMQRYKAWRVRRDNWRKNERHRPERQDYILLEYLEGGDLLTLIRRMVDDVHRAGNPDTMVVVPNRILWQIWLCLVRACVAMKYPPKKFHPHRPKPSRPSGSTDLIEHIPPPAKRWRAKRMVHFDIDPSNILIGDRSPPPIDAAHGEHEIFPRLKLADFGLATISKTYKQNIYYWMKRVIGKSGFYAPEQFGADWESIPADAHGPEAGEHEVAGNYGSPMNVWGIALTMWIVITQRTAPLPPQPQIPQGMQIPLSTPGAPAPTVDQIIQASGSRIPVSYCPWLLDGNGFFNHVDIDLRRTIYDCMYHNPEDRPRVEDLLAQAEDLVKRRYTWEPDDQVEEWVQKFVYDAQT